MIAHVVLPVADEAEASKVAKSMKRAGDFSLAFDYRGKKHEFSFARKGEGLEME